MNEDEFKQSNAPAGDSMAVPDNDQEQASSVFDISPDLGIKPETATEESSDKPHDQNSMQKMIQESLEKELSEPNLILPKTNPQIQPKITPPATPQPPSTPPPPVLPNTPIPQPPKPEYRNDVVMPSVAAKEPLNLQDAISTIIPRNTDGKNPSKSGIETDNSKMPGNISHDPQTENPTEAFSQKFANSPHIFIKPIRTYEGDVAEVLSHGKTSQTTIAMAENAKREKASKLFHPSEAKPKPTPSRKDTVLPELAPIVPFKQVRSSGIPLQNPMEKVAEPKPELPRTITPPTPPAPAVEPKLEPIPVPVAPPMPMPKFEPKPLVPEEKPLPPMPEMPQLATMAHDVPEPVKVRQVISNNYEPERKFPIKNILIVLISILLVGGGGYAAYYLYTVSPVANITAPVTVTSNTANSIIKADSHVTVPIDNTNAISIFSKVGSVIAKNTKPNTITDIVLTEKQNGSTIKVSGPQMLAKFNITPPDTFIRSMTDDWMLGSYTDETGQPSVFIITTTNFFQNAFAGMLSWEKVMPDDLKQYLLPTSSDINTSSTTPTETQSQFAPILGKFEDHIVRNKDVRTFITTGGQTLFMYSFIDNDKMVWSTTEAALSEIIKRLENQAFVR
jgi:hypothetical protein